jgi:dolichyl-phosphate beta-glucosyltransferase
MSTFETGYQPQLSIVIPCYNESTRLPRSLPIIQDYLQNSGLTYEILVVDDGSKDGTVAYVEAETAKDPYLRLLRYGENHGKGYAVRYGALRAKGQWVLFTDADLSTPITELDRFLPLMEQGYDVVIASRALAESNLQVPQPWYRERLGRLMNRLIRSVSGLKFPDTQCGFKLFSGRVAQDIFENVTVETWMFDVEALVIATKLGCTITDLPVTWINSDESRVHWYHTARVLRELLHIRLHWLGRRPVRQSVPVSQ